MNKNTMLLLIRKLYLNACNKKRCKYYRKRTGKDIQTLFREWKESVSKDCMIVVGFSYNLEIKNK